MKRIGIRPFLMVILIIFLSGVILLSTIPSRWNFDYLGLKKNDVELLLGVPDTGDFDGGIWFSESDFFGARVRLWIFKVYYSGELIVLRQEKIFAPAILVNMSEENSVFLRRFYHLKNRVNK